MSEGGRTLPGFRLGSLDHVHLVVPDRAAAATWYQAQLGFEPVEAVQEWAEVEGGPLHLSADGGQSGIALFQIGHGHDATTLEMGAAFRLDAINFSRFLESLPNDEIRSSDGGRLDFANIIDFDLCYAIDFLDPWGNRFELNCYERAPIQELIGERGITPVRYW